MRVYYAMVSQGKEDKKSSPLGAAIALTEANYHFLRRAILDFIARAKHGLR